jgi:hypothetical protein
MGSGLSHAPGFGLGGVACCGLPFWGGSGNVFAIRNIQFSKSAEADKKSPSLSLPKK